MKRLKLIFLIFLNLLLLGSGFLYYRYAYEPYLPRRSAIQESPRWQKMSCSPPSLKIAFLSDVHRSWQNLEKAVNLINQDNFSLVIFLGDLTNVGEPEELLTGKKILDQIITPFYFLPGNHDVWYSRHLGLAPDTSWQEVFKKEFLPACLTLKGFNFIFINNADEKEGLTASAWQEILDCLKIEQPTLVLSHEPLFHPLSDRLMGQHSQQVAQQAAQLRDWLCRKRVRLAVAAHLHSFSKYYYDCPDGYQVPMLVSGALAAERNFQSPRFLEVTLFEDGSFEEKERLIP
jgi:predicted phosphodiesterase